MRKTLKTLTVALAIGLSTSSAYAEALVGLTRTGNCNGNGNNCTQSLVTFDSASPMTTISNFSITNLFAGDLLLGIDLRPATNALFGISNSGRIYSISNAGAATFVATATTGPTGSSFGVDFNPTVDRLRVISDTSQNLRINPDNGVTTVDGTITVDGSPTANLVGAAYTNSFAGATATTLYALDAASNSLVRATVPNNGTYVTVGALGVPITVNNAVGFDISGATGIGYFNRQDTLYTVNLATGAATRVGNIGAGQVYGLTVAAVPEASTWAMMIFGFGIAGVSLRRRRTVALAHC